MKLSEKWLREWINPPISTAVLAEQMTMAGLEVDSITPVAESFSGVIVGEVIDCLPHPNADTLHVCKVNTGSDELLPIVCGAKNVRKGLKIALATDGAVLPGNFKIKKTKLRGEPSHGMICSAEELGLSGLSVLGTGILELPTDATIGMNLRTYLSLDDHVIDIELTPNRGDCMSIQGVAREVSAINDLPIQPVMIEPSPCEDTLEFPVQVSAPAFCPRYIGRVIQGINADAKTPFDIVLRLSAAGIRAVHPVVDICNYVMLELGQPMHGFDLEKLTGHLMVRSAKEGEQLTLLNEEIVTLQSSDFVIADQQGVQAIAGVMGGRDSGVSSSTQHIFIEAAFFDPIAVSLTARRLNLVTDASYRFERGVDSALPLLALERATDLLLKIVGGTAGRVIHIVDQNHLPLPKTIILRRHRIQRILGLNIDDAVVVKILTALRMDVVSASEGWQVTVPTARFDLTCEVDLIEEVARLYGYHQIPARNLEAPLKMDTRKVTTVTDARIADFLVDRGYCEVITYSFVEAAQQQLIFPTLIPIAVENPMSSDMNVMRTNLWPGLLKTMQYNENRQVARQKWFEMGLCFSCEGDEIHQEPYLALLGVGEIDPVQWGVSPRLMDFFDLKGDLDMLTALGHSTPLHFKPGTLAALHPQQSADLYSGDERVGYLGALHPSLVKALDLRSTPVLLHIKLSAVTRYQKTSYQPVSKFPAVHRDLAFVVDEIVTAEEMLRLIQTTSASILTKTEIFDCYQGEKIEKGKKSIALGLTFQDPSRTLVEAEINSVIQNIINALTKDLKATLRM